MLPRRFAVLCVPALLAFPAAASAEPFKDYLIPDSGPTARAAQVQGTTQNYPAGDGTMIPVTLSASYTGDPAIAQTYATFLWGAQVQDIVVFGLMLAVLLVRPYGLFGTQEVQRV